MSYSFDLGATPNPPAPEPSNLGASSAGLRTVLAGLLDQYLDPITRDYVRTDNGEWLETPDSRTIVFIILETRLGKSYSAPGDGTEIADRIETGEPLTTANVEADIRRAMSLLEAAGVVGAVDVTGRDENGEQLVDEAGRAAFLLNWIDLATGSPVEAVFRPLGG